jgi:hypothetical protein
MILFHTLTSLGTCDIPGWDIDHTSLRQVPVSLLSDINTGVKTTLQIYLRLSVQPQYHFQVHGLHFTQNINYASQVEERHIPYLNCH